MLPVFKKLGFLYNSYVLAILTIGYILGELGHYLIGVTSKQTAIELDYGDHACQLNNTELTRNQLPVECKAITNATECVAKSISGTLYCEWNYNGLGLDYQLLAGPSFILVFTIVGVVMGVLADKYNRVRMLAVCTIVFALAIIFQGSVTKCVAQSINGTLYCEWNYNGLGLDYQLLAGPSFILVFTIVGVVMGVLADKYNRVRMLAVCTIVFALAIIFQGFVTKYWHLVVLRMIMAAGESGCNPLATGIMSDIFPERKRALVMAIFNWGIYGGYGIAFPVGRYITKLDIAGLGWRICYYGAGGLAVIVAVLTGATLKEPQRQTIGEESSGQNRKQISLWKVLLQPRVLMLAFAASIRHSGGMTFAYNADLYYNIYFPDVDLGWWLFIVTIGIGSIGVVVGGVVSDKIVAKMGIKSRVAVLAISQLIATPFAFGSVYFDPLWAMITLGISYFFAEMWFGIVFAILVEIVPLQIRSTTVGIFLFVMNNVGGNLPILVDPVAKALGYRESISIFYAGFYLISSVLFFVTMFLMETSTSNEAQVNPDVQPKVPRDLGHDNRMFADETGLPHLANKSQHHNMQHQQPQRTKYENSKL